MSTYLNFYLPCFLVLLLSTCVRAQTEAQYIEALAQHLGGRQEVSVPGGRVDITTTDYAIEVERAGKWKNSIGQALWYGLQTNKKPGIILIIEQASQRKYAMQLSSALTYAGLQDAVKVWYWPEDFPGVQPATATQQTDRQTTGAATGYWLSTNSKKRHREHCRWYENSKGRYCTATEGVAAQCCH